MVVIKIGFMVDMGKEDGGYDRLPLSFMSGIDMVKGNYSVE